MSYDEECQQRVNRCKPCSNCIHGDGKDRGRYFCSKELNMNVISIDHCGYYRIAGQNSYSAQNIINVCNGLNSIK